MDPLLHILIGVLFGFVLYYGLSRLLHINLYEKWIMFLFIIAAITPDFAWIIYASEYWGIFPPAPPYLVPFAQFFHGIFGQLLLWSWVALALAYFRIATYENALTAGVAGAFLHHIIDLTSHSTGEFPLYPYVQQDWSIGYWLSQPGVLFGEATYFGIILASFFAIMFLLVIISYRQVNLFEALPKSALFFITLILTTLLCSYFIGFYITVALVFLWVTLWALWRVKFFL
jgi:hypothetical protein